jgi:hypothetical protein
MIFERIQLEEDEKIIAVIRRHWFFLFKQCFFIAVLVLLPLIAFTLIAAFIQTEFVEIIDAYLPHIIFLYSLWLLINWMMLAAIWTDHYLDIWAITNRRVIKINQVTLFKRQVASFRLERLQDLSVEINGIIATLLDYGTIHAATAGNHHEEFKADYLPNPQRIKSLILEAADQRMRVQPIETAITD